MSVFICTECGARFDGPLRDAFDGGFRHTAAHARPAQKPERLSPAEPPANSLETKEPLAAAERITNSTFRADV